MNKYKITFFLVLILTNIVSSQVGNITFSEIMFAPSQSNSEFIEIYNFGDESIDIEGYAIQYQTSNLDFIQSTDSNYKIPPNSFALIFEGDYDYENGIYKDLIPENTLIFYISDNSFGTSGMSNSSDRNLFLINSSNDTINSYTYSANNSSGISDEKIILNGNNSSENWKNSNMQNGTPGFKNSVSPLDFDLFFELFLPNQNFTVGDTVLLNAKVTNLGVQIADEFTVNFYNNKNLDSLINQTELIYTENFTTLLSGDSLFVEIEIENIELRKYQLIAKVLYNPDENIHNNIAIVEFDVNPKPINPGDLVINEIMYKPQNDEPEWIEIFNRSENEINLSNFKIYDNSSSATIPNYTIQPNSFLVIADDSLIQNYYEDPIEFITVNLPSLNNTGDILVMKNNFNTTIDSVKYFSEWGGSKNSLERIDAEIESNNSQNWSSAQFVRGTPGKINSVTKKNYDLGISNIELEKEYALVGDSFDIEITVKNLGKFESENSFVLIYFDHNKDSIFSSTEIIKTIPIPVLFMSDSVKLTEQISNYLLGWNYFKAELSYDLDEFINNNTTFFSVKGVEINLNRNDLLINEIMFAPNSDEPEWVEIYSNSAETVNLNGIMIADNSSISRVLNYDFSLEPNELIVIAKDSSIFIKHEIESKVVIAQFPSLNNNGDQVVILDSLERVIDSVEYKSTWNYQSGKSIERIDYEQSSVDSSNWKSSVAEIGSTPGKINSNAKMNYDLELADIFINPEFPLSGESIGIKSLVKNIGRTEAVFSIELAVDTDLDSLIDQNIETINNINLAVGDSVIISFNQNLTIENDEVIIIAKIIYNEDEEISNNTFYKSVKPGYEPYSLVINEIMNYPQTGDVEWIELYNRTAKPINLNNWKVADILASPTSVTIYDNRKNIEANDFLIIAKDSLIFNQYNLDRSKVIVTAFPNLNNDADGVVIKDSYGNTIDSIFYKHTWLIQKGYSLERVSTDYLQNDSTNWKPSKDNLQATPLRINSNSQKNIDLVIASINSIPSNPTINSEINLSVKIKNIGVLPSKNGKIVLDILNKEQTPIQIDFNTINGNDSLVIQTDKILITDSLQIKATIISTDEDESTNNSYEITLYSGQQRHIMLITEIMFNPNTEEPEWIEIYNTSETQLNLKDWSICDLSSINSPKRIANEFVINPKEFVVAVNDTNFISTNSKLIVNLPSLGNTEDAVIIKDIRGNTIDSVYYLGAWGYDKGVSIERFDLKNFINDSTNWFPSININGATPGFQNSVSTAKVSDFNSVIINEIMYEPDSDNSEFIEIFNKSDEYINIGGWQIIDENGTSTKVIPFEKELAPNSYFTVAADSSFIHNYSFPHESNYFINKKDRLSLSNNGEKIHLKDMFGNIIDSLTFSSSFHNSTIRLTKNKSLERINPNVSSSDRYNWSTSVNPFGATPSSENSIFTIGNEVHSKIEITPNPFSPDGDGFEDFSIISYNLNSKVAQLRIRVFDSKGRLVRTILNNQSSGGSGSFVFDGLNEDGKPLKIGIYILLIEALDSFKGTIEVFKEAIVVARIL